MPDFPELFRAPFPHEIEVSEMYVRTVTFKKVKQVSKFEPETIELTIDLEEGDTVAEAIRRARLTCAIEFGEVGGIEEVEELEQRAADLRASHTGRF